MNKRKATDRWAVMLPQRCKLHVERILDETGIDSVGKMFEMFLDRGTDDFIQAYLEFTNRRERLRTPRSSPATTEPEVYQPPEETQIFQPFEM